MMNDSSKKKVLFYVNIKKLNLLKDISFYEQDIRCLCEMGFDVCVTNKYRDLFTKKYSYIYIWWWSYALLPALYGRLTGKKVCIAGAFHYSTPLMKGTDFIRRSYLYKILVKLALRLANTNIFVSRHEYNDVVANLTVSSPKLVYHGIDTAKYTPTFSHSKEISTGVKILMISWLEKNNIERKCIIPSLLAVNKLHVAGHEIDLYIAGREGPGFLDFRDFINTLECKNRVHLLGHVTEEEKIKLLQTADIFLSPTLYEGFGVAIAEALSCGCSVITSANGAVAEVAGDCALYADPHSFADIAEKLITLVEDKNLRLDFGRAARIRIEQKFSYEKHYDALSTVISGVFVK